jgi:hypothetical protein
VFYLYDSEKFVLNGRKCRCFTVSTLFVVNLNLKIRLFLNLPNNQLFSKIIRLKSYVQHFDLMFG